MSEDRTRGRKPSRKELDRIEAQMIMRPFERREFAGDPNQPRRFWVRTRNRLLGKKD
jgi:hypothetical protein